MSQTNEIRPRPPLPRNTKLQERLYWQRENFEYTRRCIVDQHPYGMTLLRCWPMRVIRAFASRYGFEVQGDNPRTCAFVGYEVAA